MKDLVFRFLVGGFFVSVLASLGDVFRPKSFAGLFAAAPSIALATMGLTIAARGRVYAATEARSMMAGAAAFVVYAFAATQILIRYKPPTLAVTLGLIPAWLAVALTLHHFFLR
jgi:hypothetical protein